MRPFQLASYSWWIQSAPDNKTSWQVWGEGYFSLYTYICFLNTSVTYYSSSNILLCGKSFIISIPLGKPDS